MQPSAWTRRDAVAAACAGAAAVLVALHGYLTNIRRPAAPLLDSGWWSFSDQGHYLQSALAWAAGRLDPADHYYLPFYPLLAAPFTRLTPANPFLIPDLALLAATVALAAALAGWLAPGWRFARVAGAAAALASVLPPVALDAWVVPWTSTPEAALTSAALLATLHVTVRPWSWRPAFAAGLCAGALAGVRPIDAALLSAVAGAAAGFALLRSRVGWRILARTVGAVVLGGVLAATPAAALYLAVNGWHMNAYLTLSASIGFEWRLLPLRWVTLMLAPEPLFPDGQGLIAGFPWIAFGLAAMAACMVSPPGGGSRLAHALVIGETCAHFALYLCYRDLHPQGLWRFYNYHYFKWALVILALYALFLLGAMFERRGRAVLAGLAALAVLLPWRAELVRQAAPAMTAQRGETLHLPAMALGPYDAVVVPAQGSFGAIYNGQHNLYVGDEAKWYGAAADFKLTPRSGGLLLTPLRPLQAGALTLRLGPGVTLAADPPYRVRQRLVYGTPCWLPWRTSACRVPEEPGPWRHPGEALALDGQEGGMLGTGWAEAEADPAGRWTEGDVATLHLRLAPAGAGVLQVSARAFVPLRSTPLSLTLYANDRAIGHWRLSDAEAHGLRAPLPPGTLDADGALRIELVIDNPRRPADTIPGSRDLRRLGLFVRAIVIEPDAALPGPRKSP